jgi:hypothetical protein
MVLFVVCLGREVLSARLAPHVPERRVGRAIVEGTAFGGPTNRSAGTCQADLLCTVTLTILGGDMPPLRTRRAT